MSNTSPQHSASWNRASVSFLCWFTLLALLASLVPSLADEKEDEYLRIYDLVQSADTLNKTGKLRPALAKYREADTALLAFKRTYPEWNPASVSYRLNYIAVKISEVSDRITNPPATATGPAQSKAATGGSMLEVKLLEPGAQPHKELRLLPKAGDKQVLELSMKPTIEAKIGEMANPPMKMPVMKVVLELTVKDVSPEGEISFQTVFTDTTAVEEAGGDPHMVQAINSALGNLKGLTGTGTVSSRGFSKGVQFKVPADTNPAMGQALDQLKEAFENLAIPLPEESLGPGAKWEARSQVKSQGITLQQTATYELTSLDGQRAAIKSSTSQHAANQKIQNPMMPGMQADLTRMDAKGTGNVNLLLTQVLPSTGTIDFHSEVDMAMNMGPQRQPMSMKADVSVTLESK